MSRFVLLWALAGLFLSLVGRILADFLWIGVIGVYLVWALVGIAFGLTRMFQARDPSRRSRSLRDLGLLTGCGLGVASKDLSVVTGDDVTIEDCRYGVGVYQKKPEFGPATVNLTGSRIIGAETAMRVEKGSQVTINGLTHRGRELGLARELYDN